MRSSEYRSLLNRLTNLIEEAEAIEESTAKFGWVRFKPLFTTYNSCEKEFEWRFPDQFDAMEMERLPLIREDGEKGFTLGKLQTMVHQARDMRAYLEGLLPNKGTLGWYWDEAPRSLWWILASIFIFGLVVGAILGETDWGKALIQAIASRIG
jgi:hypothetical protein